MRFKSFYALLDQRFLRVSFEGLIRDYPVAYSLLKKGYELIEGYEMLDVLENKREYIDANFIIFVKDGVYPLIFPKAEYYTEQEYIAMCHLTGIKLDECEAIIEATK